MKAGNKVRCKHGLGILRDYDGDDDLWSVELEDGQVALMYPQELVLVEAQEPQVAQVRDWSHIYQVGQALRFIDQLKDRGDEPGEMLHDLLAPLAVEIEALRYEVAKLKAEK